MIKAHNKPKPLHRRYKWFYTPHPEGIKKLFQGKIIDKSSTQYFRCSDLARIQDICEIICEAIVNSRPIICPLFLRGGIPIGFGIMHRLTFHHKLAYDEVGSIFHLFPRLNAKLKSSNIEGKSFYLNEIVKVMESNNCSRLMIIDSSNSGGVACEHLNTTIELATRLGKQIELDIRILVNEENNNRPLTRYWEVKGCKGNIIRVPASRHIPKNHPPSDGYKVGPVTIVNWKYYGVSRLFYEDINPFLGATITKGEAMPKSQRTNDNVIFTTDFGADIGGCVSYSPLSQRLCHMIAQIGPTNTVFKKEYNLRHAKDKRHSDFKKNTGTTMREITDYLKLSH